MSAESTQARNKRFVWEFLHGINAENYQRHLARGFAGDAGWQGPHPINRLDGIESIMGDYYRPLFASFPDLKRQDDLFFAGRWRGADWVCASGHYVGIFANDWLDIPATGKKTRVRFGEFYKIVESMITESYVLIDMIDVMQRSGVQLLPPCLGDDAPVPGPDTNDGILMSDQSETESEKTAQLVDDMIEDLMRFDPVSRDYTVMRHDRCWHQDMKWYGPAGIGTAHGIDGFIEHHQRPFLKAFPDRKAGDKHVARPSEGHYVGSTGWPSVEATHSGDGWLGQPASNRKVGMRVMDFWRRDGDKFSENWVLIDIPELLLQMDVDLFEQLRSRQEAI